MRVIGGEARGRPLQAPRGLRTRPTSDLVRGAVFSMLEARRTGFSRVLDLYAGSGAMGIEALSRGAAWCDFVERDPKACAVIAANLAATGLVGRAAVHRMDAARAIERLSGIYTLVIADPPYDDEAADRVIERLMYSPLVSGTTILVWERSRRRPRPSTAGALRAVAERRHGDTIILLFMQERAQEAAPLIKAVYPGRFDPVTNGHLDIVARAARLFDRLIVAVPEFEGGMFSTQERVEMFREAVRELPNVEVKPFAGLTIEFARSEEATVLVRGIRAVTGFEAEFDMALMNKKMAPEIESIFLMASLEQMFVSASRIRELASLGRDVSDLVPPHVADALHTKLRQQR